MKSEKQEIVDGVFDLKSDSEIMGDKMPVGSDSVILFDGVFLQRPELYPYWDLKVFLDVSFDEVQRRAVVRDKELFGSDETTLAKYRGRYIPGEKIYLSEVRPAEKADIVIDNNDYRNPLSSGQI